jgi:hypothetical protein
MKTMDIENQADEMRCFWCTGSWDKYEQPVIIARQVCDTDGSHEELTFLHHDCALAAVQELSSVPIIRASK